MTPQGHRKVKVKKKRSVELSFIQLFICSFIQQIFAARHCMESWGYGGGIKDTHMLFLCRAWDSASVQLSGSVVSDSLWPHGLQHSSFPVHHQLLEFTQTHVHWISDTIQPSHPLSSPSPAFIFPSIRVFSNESVLHIRWPKYGSVSFRISPSNEYSGLISFRMDWLDLLAVQGTLKSLLQHHSSKHQFFGSQLSL